VAQGVLVPIGDDVQVRAVEEYILKERYGPSGTGVIDEADASRIDAILRRVFATQILTVDRERLGDSCEAWVYVQVGLHPAQYPRGNITSDERTRQDPDSAASQIAFRIFGFGQTKGVLTWPNCD
jgi:hypothetical protein